MNNTERTVQIALDFELTESDLAGKAREASGLDQEICQLEVELADVNKTMKNRLKAKQTELRAVHREIARGMESRVVDCKEKKDFTRSVVEYWYAGECRQSRPMTDEERQMELG